MASQNINFKLKCPPYKDRLLTDFKMSAIIAGIGAACTMFSFGTLDGIIIAAISLGISFKNQLKWSFTALESIQTDSIGVHMKFYEKDDLYSATISWEKLEMDKSNSFTITPRRKLQLNEGDENVVAFFGWKKDHDLSNDQVDSLFRQLEELKSGHLQNATI